VAIVFAGVVVEPTRRLRERLAGMRDPLVVAADRGAETALAFGLMPHLAVGDFDSIDPPALARLRDAGVAVRAVPADKDETDGELAVRAALELGADVLLLLGFLGGTRLDHASTNLLMLTRLPGTATLLDEQNEVQLLRGGERLAWRAERREIVSLVPIGAEAVGVTTEGLRWRLEAATLPLGGTRGVSNEPAAAEVAVSVREGLLLVTRHFR
jgi:thiamine pyrophosphokinase